MPIADAHGFAVFIVGGWLTGIFGGGTGIGLGFLTGMDWTAIVAVGGLALVAVILFFIFRHQVVAAVKEVRADLG
jgi:putative chitinase